MGLFDALFGNRRTNVVVVPDRIWLTTDAKYAGLSKEAEQRSQSDTVAILLVAHFSDVLAKLDQIASQSAWNIPCMSVSASSLNAELAASLDLDRSSVIDVIVGERHPLPSVDDHLEAFANELPCRCRFAHHVSLEDSVMQVFVGETVKNMLKKMGMEEAQAIESQMVSRRIRQAQQKIEGRAFGAADAQSASEWLEKNCPELAKG